MQKSEATHGEGYNCVSHVAFEEGCEDQPVSSQLGWLDTKHDGLRALKAQTGAVRVHGVFKGTRHVENRLDLNKRAEI